MVIIIIECFWYRTKKRKDFPYTGKKGKANRRELSVPHSASSVLIIIFHFAFARIQFYFYLWWFASLHNFIYCESVLYASIGSLTSAKSINKTRPHLDTVRWVHHWTHKHRKTKVFESNAKIAFQFYKTKIRRKQEPDQGYYVCLCAQAKSPISNSFCFSQP